MISAVCLEHNISPDLSEIIPVRGRRRGVVLSIGISFFTAYHTFPDINELFFKKSFNNIYDVYFIFRLSEMKYVNQAIK